MTTKIKATKKPAKVIKKGTLVTLILDESGSMEDCKAATISGYNEYIQTLRKKGKDIKFSLTKFDSSHVTTILDSIDIKNVPDLNGESYRPGASTPLYDALGKTINSTNDKKRNVLCVILTDGQENSSHEYTKESINKLITKKTKEGWTFVYLGANQDAWSVGMSLGIAKGNTKNYSTKDIKGVFCMLATSNANYSTRGMSAGYATSNVFGQDENNPDLQLSTK